MKKYSLAFFGLLLLAVGLWSCEKDDNQVIFEDGVAPALTASIPGGSTDSISLLKANSELPAITFNWTNPTYRLNTGVSSQNVNYALQLRKANGPWVSVSSATVELNKTYTQGQINDFLIKSVSEGGLGLNFDSTVRIEARLTSYIGALSEANATNLSSNILSFKARTYSVFPDLWITGEAAPSNWTNTPPANQKFDYDPVTKNHTITVPLTGGIFYKFLTVSGQWQPQWGVASGTITDVLGQTFSIVENPGNTSDPDAMKAPAASRSYKITVNLPAKTAKVEL
jgi:hypothetical protein